MFEFQELLCHFPTGNRTPLPFPEQVIIDNNKMLWNGAYEIIKCCPFLWIYFPRKGLWLGFYKSVSLIHLLVIHLNWDSADFFKVVEVLVNLPRHAPPLKNCQFIILVKNLTFCERIFFWASPTCFCYIFNFQLWTTIFQVLTTPKRIRGFSFDKNWHCIVKTVFLTATVTLCYGHCHVGLQRHETGFVY